MPEDFATVLADCQAKGELEKRLATVDSCINEALRLQASFQPLREVKRDVQVTVSSGVKYAFRKGDKLYFASTVSHKDADIYADPEAFHYDVRAPGCQSNSTPIRRSVFLAPFCCV